jgi:hypothetical protein
MDLLVNFELDDIPLYLLQCIETNSAFSKDCSIYNNLLAMAATKVCNYSATSGWTQRGPGSASVTLNGRVHHYLPTVNSSDPSCGLSYFIFDDDTAQAGSVMSHNVDQSILCTLREGLKLHNPYCINLRQLGLEARERQINSNQQRNIVPTMKNQPRHLDICSVINSRQNNHLVLEVQETDGSRLCDIAMDSKHVEPLCFPLLFPCGHAGWTREMKKDLTAEQYLIARLLKPEKLGSNFLTAFAQYASARVDCRTGEPFDANENVAIINEFQIVDLLVQAKLRVNRFQLLSRIGQYYAMDFYSRVLDARIDCVQHLSKRIMMGQVRAKTSAALAQEEENRNAAGFGNPDCSNKKETYVPDSTHGSPRHMAALAKNALVLVSESGCPHVFLTLTCNPNWPEITSQLLVGQSAFDRPDVVCPVFKARLDQLKHNIRKGKYFEGRNVTYMLHVIEYQFRGLPHAHMAIRLMNCFEIDDDDSDGLINFVNRNFIAEMPRFAGEEYQNVFEEEGGQCFDDAYKEKAVELVRKCNIHRCAIAVNACKRKETDQCRRGYNRSEAIQATYIDKNKSRMVYRRRSVADDLLVVPYNLSMLMDWGSHINVEYSGSAFSVLYIYKYLYKGASKKEHIELTSEQEHDSEDEIKLFIYGRVMCSMAAFWRLYGYQDYPASEPAVVSFKVRTGAQLDDFFQRGQLTDLMVYYNRPVLLHHLTFAKFWQIYNANSVLPKHYQERPALENVSYFQVMIQFAASCATHFIYRPVHTVHRCVRIEMLYQTVGDIYYLRLILLKRPVLNDKDARTFHPTRGGGHQPST